ncbi:MAG TPA: 50S ribosomal protein L25 [Verrucomicrobiae bacterium]|nr:50S ribosomal protein L25 [Verrucomicrobiae bacterium]
MKSVSLNAFPRQQVRRSGVKKLRNSHRIPAVIYGRQQEPQNLEVDAKDMEDLVHHSISENVLVDLAVKDDKRPKRLALVQDVQHHVLSGAMLHVDFHEVAEDEKVKIMVPVESTGEATGVKNGGGVLEHVLFKIQVRALPKDLPEVITLDVAHLEIGQAIHIGDIKPPAGVEILGDKHISVIAVAAPITEAQEAAATAAAEGATADVEMIKEKKEEGGEAPAAPAKGAEKAPSAKAGEKPAAPAADKGAEKKAEKKK